MKRVMRYVLLSLAIATGMLQASCKGKPNKQAQPSHAKKGPRILTTDPQTQDPQAIVPNNAGDIDAGIRNLNYNKDEVLASSGEAVASFVPKEGMHKGDKFIVVRREKKSLATTPIDISIPDAMVSRSYPGAVQLADRLFVDNKPTLLTAKRKPLKISIDLPGLGRKNTAVVANPTYGNVSGAIDSLTNRWFKQASSTHKASARLQHNESMVYSKSQLAAALNINADFADKKLKVDFNAASSGEKKIMIARFKQIFYTVTATPPDSPSELFDDSVTFAELQNRGVSNATPPLIVSNVSYGREILVKMETNSKDSNVEAAFKAAAKGIEVEASGKYADIYKSSSFTVVVLGGGAKEHSQTVLGDFNAVRKVIADNAEFSANNPAFPLSYLSTFLKDNSVAAVHNNSEYVETTSTEYSSGKMTLYHNGWYVAKFSVEWDELSFDNKGNEVVTHKTWDGNDHNKTAPFSTVIPLPANAQHIQVLAKGATGLAWDPWRTAVHERNVPLTKEIKVSLWGASWSPTGEITHPNSQM